MSHWNQLLKVFIDGIEMKNVERHDRPDVLMTYEEQYGGYASNDLPGWQVIVDLKNIDLGKHEIRVDVFDERKID